MLKVGIFGAGHLGKIHIQQWKHIEGVDLVGFYDPNDEHAAKVVAEWGIPRFEDVDALIAAADAIDIVATTTVHFEIAKKSALAGKHIFVEKPLTQTIEEAKELVKLVKEAGIKCQVGHVERYNPALRAIDGQLLQPMFIESHRLAQFNPRGTDVSVILDLMIHDIDIVLHLVDSAVKRISACGVAVISESADIANARIEFDNGCVANLTASRMSLKNMRKMRLFQRDAYIGVDFLEKRTEVVKLKDETEQKGVLDFPLELNNGERKIISVETPEVDMQNAIRMELQDFADAIRYCKKIKVTEYDGYMAMDVAYQILKKMNNHNELHNVL